MDELDLLKKDWDKSTKKYPNLIYEIHVILIRLFKKGNKTH